MTTSRKITIDSVELAIGNEVEILRMGGPWTGDIYIGADLVSKDCLSDNFVYEKEMNLLFFVKFNKVSKDKWYFSINFYNIETRELYEFDKIFDMVYLGEFIDKSTLEIFNSFNNTLDNKRLIFNLDEEEFHRVG